MITALLDTNIIMDMEDTGKPLSQLCATVMQKSRGNVDFFMHPLQREDINNDTNVTRRQLLLTRIEQFKVIENPPEAAEDMFIRRGWETSSRNDYIDNTLLFCVEKHVVGFLITNDRAMLAKAERSGFRERVLRLDEFEQILPTEATPPHLAAVEERYCYEFDVHDHFFDSLRCSYTGFDAWYQRCCEQQRKCWVVRQRGELGAICIYKDEDSEAVNDQGLIPAGKTLKLCTFKVSESARGYKMGERLIFCAIQYAKDNGHVAVYFTTDPDNQNQLVELGHNFGFDACGTHGNDTVYLKYLAPQSDADFSYDVAEYNRRFYPSYKTDAKVGKYLVPINPQWHEQLFPDISDISHSLLRDFADFYKAEGNTIQKAYLSRSQITAPKVGDLLLFYRTDDRQAIDTLGVVVSATRSDNVDEIVALTKRRTVYEPKAIQEMAREAQKGLLVISFNLIRYFEEHPVPLGEMEELGVYAPQSITLLTNEKFDGLMELLA